MRFYNSSTRVLFMALSMMSVGSLAHGNIINSCSTTNPTAGTATSCTFSANTGNQTGTLNIGETFTSTFGNLSVGLFLTNTIAGNNVPGIFDYTVTKTILNNTGVAWTGISVTTPNASTLGPVISVSGLNGFTSCTTPAGNAFSCSGGTVNNGGTLVVSFHLSTPTDQGSGAFAITQSVTTAPEPGTYMSVAGSLFLLGLYRRNKTTRV